VISIQCLVIYEKANGNVIGIWEDHKNNTLQSIYKNNEDKLNQYSQIILNIGSDIVSNKFNYQIINEQIVLRDDL